MIIGISGFIGCGKDTTADYLVNVHQFRRESFAGTLKDATASVFGWDRALLEGRTRESREWREEIDEWWAQRLDIPHLTPRWILQQWGTEVCRKGFHNDIWVASLENKLRKTRDDVAISDCRFPNEMKAIRRVGGRVVWVQRGPIPDWFDTAIQANKGDVAAQREIEQRGIHASESGWAGFDFDRILDNNGNLEHLYQQINNLVRDLQHEPPNHSLPVPLSSSNR